MVTVRYAVWLLMVVTVAPRGEVAAEKLDNFMNCDKYSKNIWGILRICCKSEELPNGCECFDISNNVAFNYNTKTSKPWCPSDIEASFTLYNSATGANGRPIKANKQSIQSSRFNPSLPTKVVVHGFNDKGDSSWMLEMKNELLKMVESCNVILVDWQKGASAAYYQAAANTRTVGAMIARLVLELRGAYGISYTKFHMIGHSLGAHIMGYSGEEIRRLTGNKKLGRITGLDPAGLAFESYDAPVRIDSSDAHFVDIIHTDAESLTEFGFGTRYSIGHVDFYPNGGRHQPGCPKERINVWELLTNFEAQIDNIACSHGRAIYFFIDSINNCSDTISDCSMGYHTASSCRGDIKPTTTDHRPFCEK